MTGVGGESCKSPSGQEHQRALEQLGTLLAGKPALARFVAAVGRCAGPRHWAITVGAFVEENPEYAVRKRRTSRAREPAGSRLPAWRVARNLREYVLRVRSLASERRAQLPAGEAWMARLMWSGGHASLDAVIEVRLLRRDFPLPEHQRLEWELAHREALQAADHLRPEGSLPLDALGAARAAHDLLERALTRVGVIWQLLRRKEGA